MIRTLAAAVLFAHLCAGTLFNDLVSCTVQGYVYRMAEQDELSWTAGNFCNGIKTESDQTSVILHSPHVWVRITVPPDYGNRTLQYQWGAKTVQIGGVTFDVTAFGRVGKG